jgi:PAS domain S-box-containing protein
MTKDRPEPDQLTKLRREAQSRMERETMDIPDLSQGEVRRLVYELRTHQIELEMQNEELRLAQEELVASRDRFSDLYDFAPIGYMTIGYKGLILEANLTATKMLGIERRLLVNQPFSAFIVPDDQDAYYLHRQEIIASKQGHTCQVRLLRRGGEPFWVEMASIPIEADEENDSRFRTLITDITDRKRIEEEKRFLEYQM